MDKVETSTLVDELLLELPGCPSLVAQKALERAVRDWYKDTYSWHEELPAFTTAIGVKSYLVTPPQHTVILAIDSLARSNGGHYGNNAWAFSEPRSIEFYQEPVPDTTLTPIAVLSLSRGAGFVPCSHVSKWLDDWMHGALWYLRMQVGMPWYEANESERNRNLFRSAILAQRIRQSTGNRTGDLSVNMSKFI